MLIVIVVKACKELFAREITKKYNESRPRVNFLIAI